jgi:glycosyltransferase involved in cell wall biosynthesis
MSNDPLVSVIIPTYNRAGIISRTIDNVFQQTYRNLELIIVDDGSTDNTQTKLRQYGSRIRVITQSNAGPSIARNNGASMARGEIIAFQDSDDLWQPTKLQRQVALLEADRRIPCCLCNVSMRVINGKAFTSFDHSLIRVHDAEGIWVNVLDVLATRFILFNQAAAIRRDAFERVGGFPEDLKYLEDYDLPLRLSLEGPWAFIRDPLVIYGEDSPLSFSDQAKKDLATLRKCEVTICERMLAKISADARHESARRSLKRRLRTAQQHLTASRLQNGGHSIARIVNTFLINWDRYWLAGLRRSPWFPQPKTISRPAPRQIS